MKLQFVTILSLLISTNLFAHGMNKPGPNGGYIRMPGAFHTELVEKESHFQVFILDINFKPLSADDMKITADYKGQKDVGVTCNKKDAIFYCAKPTQQMNTFESINLKIWKNNKQTAPATYNLPLKLM